MVARMTSLTTLTSYGRADASTRMTMMMMVMMKTGIPGGSARTFGLPHWGLTPLHRDNLNGMGSANLGRVLLLQRAPRATTMTTTPPAAAAAVTTVAAAAMFIVVIPNASLQRCFFFAPLHCARHGGRYLLPARHRACFQELGHVQFKLGRGSGVEDFDLKRHVSHLPSDRSATNMCLHVSLPWTECKSNNLLCCWHQIPAYGRAMHRC